jgi:cell division septum initiation protein DivIVA
MTKQKPTRQPEIEQLADKIEKLTNEVTILKAQLAAKSIHEQWCPHYRTATSPATTAARPIEFVPTPPQPDQTQNFADYHTPGHPMGPDKPNLTSTKCLIPEPGYPKLPRSTRRGRKTILSRRAEKAF